MYNIFCMVFIYFLGEVFCEASQSFMMSHLFHNTIRGMKCMAMNELPRHVIYIERYIPDWIHIKSNNVLLWMCLLSEFNYFNCNEL